MTRFFYGFFTALIGSVLVNLIILFILKPFVIDPAMPLHALSIGPVVGLTAFGAIGATIVYAIIRHFITPPDMVFTWVSGVVLLLSFIPDYLVTGSTTGPFAGATIPSTLTLALMHLVAALIIVISLTRLWGARRAALATSQTTPLTNNPI